jgi:catechol 2,3-dioxygenase-like lactoylglutathione lyase family enzyme
MEKKSMTSRIVTLLMAAFVLARSASAQVPPPNAAGVSAGHEHFRAVDVDAANRFWIALGGVLTSVGQGQVPVVKFPGVFVMIARATAENPVAGGTEGSSVEVIRFRVKDLKSTLGRMEAAGYKPLPNSTGERAYLAAAHDARVQLVEDRSLAASIVTDAIIMTVPNVAEAAAWYAKWFGAKAVRRGQTTYAEIPGMDIQFVESKEPIAPTRGRALDHIGFEVKNLEAFMKKLADGGVTVVRPFSPPPAAFTPTLKSLAFIMDPWGTYIELNEGFSDIK